MTPNERDIEKLKNKIAESKNTIKTANQNGALVVAFAGIVLIFSLLFWVLVLNFLLLD